MPKVILEQFRVKNSAQENEMLDEGWNIDKCLKKFKIAIVRLKNYEMEFDLIGIPPAFANAFRRLMLSEVPSMAIEKVIVRNNFSIMQDEVLAHRLGLIPLKADPRLFEYRSQEDTEGTELNTLTFSLKVKCNNVQHQKTNSHRNEDLYDNENVYSAKIKWLPFGSQATIYKEVDIGPVHKDILITKLRPSHELDLELVAVKGIGKDHAKFSPVETATYRMLPEIKLTRKVMEPQATLLKSCFSPGVIDIDSDGMAYVRDARYDTCSRNVYRYEELKDCVELSRIRDHFIFNVESVGALPPDVIFIEAVKTLNEKCKLLLKELNKI